MSNSTQKAKGHNTQAKEPKILGPDEAVPDTATAHLPVVEHTEFEEADLPSFQDPRFAFYAVRLRGDAGFWPALPVEMETGLCNPDPHKTRIYPRGRSGERFPGSKFETPDRNTLMRVQLEGGQTALMYLADAFAHDLVILDDVLVKRRAWRRVDNNDIIYFEDTSAAATGQWQPIVEVVGWCPLKGPDDNGYPTDHGRIYAKGEKVDGRSDLLGTGACLKCRTRQLKTEALKKVMDLRGETLELI